MWPNIQMILIDGAEGFGGAPGDALARQVRSRCPPARLLPKYAAVGSLTAGPLGCFSFILSDCKSCCIDR